MRFVILTQYYHPEIVAPALRWSGIGKELQKQGHSVVVLTTFPSHRISSVPERYRRKLFLAEELDGLKIVRVWAVPHPRKHVKLRVFSYLSFVITSCIGAAAAGPADVVIVHSPPIFTGLAGLAIARTKRAKMILSVSDLWPDSVEALGVVRNKAILGVTGWLARALYRRSWKVAAATEGIRQGLLAAGVPEEKIVMLPNGVDTETFSPRHAGAAEGAQAEECVFTYAGNIGLAQDFDIILCAAERLRDRPGIVFEIVGEGPEKQRLRAEIERRKLANVRVRAAVPPANLPDVYARARASLVTLKKTQLSEGSRPSKTMVAMACGAPILYAGAGEAAQIIENAGCGIVVEPENDAELAEAVLRLCEDPARAREMGARARQYAQENFSWHALVQDFLAAIEADSPNKE
jgi:glycosyltransferase involved in cell wall biosynthesis